MGTGCNSYKAGDFFVRVTPSKHRSHPGDPLVAGCPHGKPHDVVERWQRLTRTAEPAADGLHRTTDARPRPAFRLRGALDTGHGDTRCSRPFGVGPGCVMAVEVMPAVPSSAAKAQSQAVGSSDLRRSGDGEQRADDASKRWRRREDGLTLIWRRRPRQAKGVTRGGKSSKKPSAVAARTAWATCTEEVSRALPLASPRPLAKALAAALALGTAPPLEVALDRPLPLCPRPPGPRPSPSLGPSPSLSPKPQPRP